MPEVENNKVLIPLVWKGEPSANRYGRSWGIEQGLLIDLRRMRRILMDNGFTAKYVDIHDAWEEYSCEECCAGWLDLPTDNQTILEVLLRYLKTNNGYEISPVVTTYIEKSSILDYIRMWSNTLRLTEGTNSRTHPRIWIRLRVPSKKNGRKGTRRDWKRKHPPRWMTLMAVDWEGVGERVLSLPFELQYDGSQEGLLKDG